MLSRRQLLMSVPVVAGLEAQEPAPVPTRIRTVDIFHHSHLDVGYTDSPSVARDMHKRFFDAALDTCLRDKRFRWTAEALLVVHDWWRTSSGQRRSQLLELVQSGRVDIMALPFNQAPFLNADQWRRMLSWAPEELWRQWNPRAAMQSDVNGFPRAGAVRLADKGIRHLLMGINADSGGPPFKRPSAFWWKLPDGRRVFVWLGEHYGTAFQRFEGKMWRRLSGRGGETSLGPPRPGEVLATDEQSLRSAHRNFTAWLKQLGAEGYPFERLILSYTNQWRYDNDPPFPPLADFIEAWNDLGLQPQLRFTTATDAVFAMEREVGGRIPVHEGEWTDWWANGDASAPREVAASRAAKRYLTAAMSPVWGPVPPDTQPEIEAILEDLCLFDEHTWGADVSIKQPEGLNTLGQFTEKSLLAYRPMAKAEWLLGRRARTKLAAFPEGLYVVNSARQTFSGWVRFPANALRGDYRSVEHAASGAKAALLNDAEGSLMFWATGLPAVSIAQYRLSKNVFSEPGESCKPEVENDSNGWPVSARWAGAAQPLFSGEMGHFLSVGVVPPASRDDILRMHKTTDVEKREEMRRKVLAQAPASYGVAVAAETAHTLVYTQPVQHPRLRDATRRLELWKCEPRARLSMRFDRTSSLAPEVFYIAFALPVHEAMPVFSNGGLRFVPYRDQLEGSCRDYYAIDGWAHYATTSGNWLWVTRDAPLIAVGGPHTVARRTTAPTDTHRLLAMVFDNCWHTNFVANSHGKMEFVFDLVWRDRLQSKDLSEALVTEPLIVINPSARESPELLRNVFRP